METQGVLRSQYQITLRLTLTLCAVIEAHAHAYAHTMKKQVPSSMSVRVTVSYICGHIHCIEWPCSLILKQLDIWHLIQLSFEQITRYSSYRKAFSHWHRGGPGANVLMLIINLYNLYTRPSWRTPWAYGGSLVLCVCVCVCVCGYICIYIYIYIYIIWYIYI